MSEYYCPNCGTDLDNQPGFDPTAGYWTCTKCGQFLMDPEDDSNETSQYKDVGWFCDNCGAYLNKQYGFSDWNSTWQCTECGYINNISDDEIYESEAEYQASRQEADYYNNNYETENGNSKYNYTYDEDADDYKDEKDGDDDYNYEDVENDRDECDEENDDNGIKTSKRLEAKLFFLVSTVLYVFSCWHFSIWNTSKLGISLIIILFGPAFIASISPQVKSKNIFVLFKIFIWIGYYILFALIGLIVMLIL